MYDYTSGLKFERVLHKEDKYDVPPLNDTSYNLVKGGRNG
jgi:hypothetical protein